MASVSEILRTAREKQGLTVPQVAEATKMRSDYVRALENGDYSVFNANVYIRGFVRNYAKLVKVNVPQIMAQLESELSQSGRLKEPARSGKSKSPMDFVMFQLSRIDWRLALPLLAGAALLVGGIIGYQAWRERAKHDPLAELRPALYQAKPVSLGETLPLSTNVPKR